MTSEIREDSYNKRIFQQLIYYINQISNKNLSIHILQVSKWQGNYTGHFRIETASSNFQQLLSNDGI